ncbi:MAG: hypothetical protein JW963_06410 [Anaerolineales bacterium]|nr:hypothetical protein [Anaerolineales bacterium]
MNDLKLNDRADVFHLSLYAPRVMGQKAVGPITKAGTSLALCEEIARRTPGWTVHTDIVERITISRPDREGDSRTYDLTTHSATVRCLIAQILLMDWPTRDKTPAGWDGYSTI